MTLDKRSGWTIAPLLFAFGSLCVTLFGGLSEGGYHFWPFALLGTTLVAFAVFRTRKWWLLLLVPIILSPMALIILLAAACTFGDCV